MKKEGCVSGFMEGVLLALVLPYLRRRRMGALGRSMLAPVRISFFNDLHW
jgi:hypothetical protein